ncbi:metallophosphoesterase [Jejudonia soesokkakensis]|uniref:Metallophosphoesterase n=1 Tax=Jejudonia soesokkakensis TaxID=1323432 RepID=A0ABW2MRB5_9FLAO
MLKKIISLLLLSILVFSCASYEAQYREPRTTSLYPSEKEIEKTFYLVGDAGKSKMGGMSDGLKVFNNLLKQQERKGDYTIFLGDNIYPVGMYPEGHPLRPLAQHALDAQYNAAKGNGGKIYFIPGNHDWYNDGLEGLKREENYLLETTKDPDIFQPKNGCPLSSVTVSDQIQLIMIDSQWYLEDWNFRPSINENCEIKSREKFFIEIENELKKHQNKTIVFAMHHPMFTNGTHGGFFGSKKHLYPTQKNIPLPILSSLVVQIRSQGGVSVQDRYNELYNNLMNRLGAIAKNSDRIVFASGHEHNLQYIEQNGLKQIVTGSGAKDGGVALGKDGLFAIGKQGFAVMDVFKDGSSWVRYYVGDANHQPKLMYEKELFPPKDTYDVSKLPVSFQPKRLAPIYKSDSLRESLFLKSVWGAKYKEAFSTPVTADIAILDTLYGGLSVIREGGEKEYRSLRLKDENGNVYRMRALGKNSLDFSQKVQLENPVIEEGTEETTEVLSPTLFDEEFYTASHPYAVLAVPTLAKAVNIFYTNAQLYYVPKQLALGNYNENFGDELYLISNEPTEESEGARTFKYPDDVETTDDILTKIRKNGDIQVDEENYIRSRLFDMLIGDWDRESDHWRWAEYNNSSGKNVYVPIPKNRDDAFASFDGDVFDIARSIFAGSRITHVYDNDLRDLEWFNKEGIILDRALIERSGRSQWKYVAESIQNAITPEIIEEAFNKIPEEVRDEELAIIKEKLIARKDNLVDIADRYYNYFSNLQTIAGTDTDDYFEITRLPDGGTKVKTYSFSEGKKSEIITDRTYYHKDTRELWIYGLDGKDVFVVDGEDSDLIYVRLIGGKGEDVYNIKTGRRVKVYDYRTYPSKVVENEDAQLIFTDLYNLNVYDYRKQLETNKRVGPAFGYNPDDGFRVGLQFVYTRNSFKRNPFSKRHTITGGYYVDTSSFDVAYEGEFANSIGDSNLNIGLRITSPNYTENYFGYGNETNNLEDSENLEFNRLELQTITAKAGLVRNSSFGIIYRFQTRFDAVRLNEANTNLYLDKGDVELNDTNYFATAEGIFTYRSFDNPLNPARAMLFDLSLGITENVEDLDNIFGYLKSKVTFYNALTSNEKLVLKTNIQSAFNFGNRFEFYQGVHAGADTGLRGYRRNRFTGKSALVGSADVRYSFDDFRIELFPLQVGIYVGADLGRVWTPNDTSQKWHNSRGGGLWINSQGGLGATFSAFNSEEGTRLNLGVGFTF